MKLKALQKRKAEKDVPQEASKSATNDVNRDVLTANIQIRYNTLHYSTLQTTIESQHNAGDYTYTSVADIVRAALQAYREGMPLSELDAKGGKSAFSVRVTPELREFFDTLPVRMKSKITERAVRTFVKREFR